MQEEKSLAHEPHLLGNLLHGALKQDPISKELILAEARADPYVLAATIGAGVALLDKLIEAGLSPDASRQALINGQSLLARIGMVRESFGNRPELDRESREELDRSLAFDAGLLQQLLDRLRAA